MRISSGHTQECVNAVVIRGGTTGSDKIKNNLKLHPKLEMILSRSCFAFNLFFFFSPTYLSKEEAEPLAVIQPARLIAATEVSKIPRISYKVEILSLQNVLHKLSVLHKIPLRYMFPRGLPGFKQRNAITIQ